MTIKLIHIVFVLTVGVGFTGGCQQQKQASSDEMKCNEDFDGFYQKFHSDSVFQMERIDFPLKGVYRTGDENPDEVNNDFRWNKESWKMQKPFEVDKTIYREELNRSDTLVVHRIYIENSGFSIERKFKLIKCKWVLVFYSEIDL